MWSELKPAVLAVIIEVVVTVVAFLAITRLLPHADHGTIWLISLFVAPMAYLVYHILGACGDEFTEQGPVEGEV